MIVGPPITKQSTEIVDWSVDFRHELDTGQYIVSATFLAVRESDSTDATDDLEQTTREIIGTSVVAQLVKAGTDGQSYMMELQAVDNTGRIFEAERRLIVKDVITKPVAP